MSRSGYDNDGDYEPWSHIMWRGQVASAIRGKRGQSFLRELVAALDAMPEKRLIAHNLIVSPADTYGPPPEWQFYRDIKADSECGVCAIGAVGVKRGVNLYSLDPDNYNSIADAFGIAPQLVQEIECINDDTWFGANTPEARWQRVRDWAAARIKDATSE
ncbi:MAG: hypothetical protein KGL35_11855 [Bradyrhizobium sp.]|nr:hypothetical protein [Bradyrhizobium sp.]